MEGSNSSQDASERAREISRQMTNLSPEELAFLKRARIEAALHRGYPLALISMGSTLYGISKYFPKWVRWQKWTLVGVVGIVANGVGKISYLPTIRRKMEAELPPDSILRKAARNFRTGNWSNLDENPDESSYNTGVEFGVEDKGSEEQKKFVSYGDLQKQHRQRQGWPTPNEKASGEGQFESKLPRHTRRDEELVVQKDNDFAYDADRQDSYIQAEDLSDLPNPSSYSAPRYNKYGDLIQG